MGNLFDDDDIQGQMLIEELLELELLKIERECPFRLCAPRPDCLCRKYQKSEARIESFINKVRSDHERRNRGRGFCPPV